MPRIYRNESGYGSRNRNKLPVIAGVSVIGATVIAGVFGPRDDSKTNSSRDEQPVPTTIVVAQEGDNIWDLTANQMRIDGIDPSKVEHRGDYVDPNVALNNGDASIIAGQQVTLRDLPDQGPPITEAP